MDNCRILFVCCQDATMSEIESRLYDQFNITVRDVKVLLADSGECFPYSRRIFHCPFTPKTSQHNQRFCCVLQRFCVKCSHIVIAVETRFTNEVQRIYASHSSSSVLESSVFLRFGGHMVNCAQKKHLANRGGLCAVHDVLYPANCTFLKLCIQTCGPCFGHPLDQCFQLQLPSAP